MQYNITVISDIVKGQLLGESEAVISDLLIDSRKLGNAASALFFAIKGERHDGHHYIQELYHKGVHHFVVSRMEDDYRQLKHAVFIVVEDTLSALHDLCAAHRKQFHIPVIAITGSNGKTIVKEWLYQLLREDKNIVRSPKSFNSQVGVPLSVWQINADHTMGVFEAGISKPGEMQALEKIIAPSIGIITNIGKAHDENFQTAEQKTCEKLKLFTHAEELIYCKDHLLINNEIVSAAAFKNKQLFTWSKKSNADLLIGRIVKTTLETEIHGVYKNNFISITIPFTDEASIENAIHCWALLLHLGYDAKTINNRMRLLSPIAMRLELKDGINNCSIINDTYNSDLGSLAIALDFLNQQKQHPKKTVIISDILQSGQTNEQLYKAVAELVHKKGVNRIIGIGKGISGQEHLFNIEKLFFETTADFLTAYTPQMFRDETILIKGARAFGFEAIIKTMQQKAHQTVLEINLNSLIHNLNYYRAKLKPETMVMAMVKAFSYGSGSFEIANTLQFHRINYLAVAYADEGVELRKAGITVPIMVMNPEEDSYDAMIKYHLEPEIFSFRVLDLFEQALQRLMPSSGSGPLPIHIKLDTGMRRLGFEDNDIDELIVRIKNNKQLQIKSVFSHLVASDDKVHDAFTRKQMELFDAMSEKIKQQFNYPILKHILNSAGISNYPQAQFDMVRLGIGLYGIGADADEQKQLAGVSTLKTCISQIKQVPAGETVGYSRKGVAKGNITIATVPIGYADGLSRKLSNGVGKMVVNGKLAPIIGNVCMDMCMIDITGINATENDEVIVFGEAYPISQVAQDVGTIPYEILTNVSRRVKRVYYQE